MAIIKANSKHLNFIEVIEIILNNTIATTPLITLLGSFISVGNYCSFRWFS